MTITITMTNEILGMNELDRVSGGTWKEYKEIADLLPAVPQDIFEDRGYFSGSFRRMKPDEVQKWLKDKLNISANIDVGSKWNLSPRSGEKNTYTQNGKSLTHSKVIAEIKNFGY